jgi:hypothetical protein
VSVELPLGELHVINAAVLWKCLLAVQLCTHSSPCALPRVLIMANKSWFLDAPIRRLGDRIVGTGSPVYITAEIGINHNGDLATAVASRRIGASRNQDLFAMMISTGWFIAMASSRERCQERRASSRRRSRRRRLRCGPVAPDDP